MLPLPPAVWPAPAPTTRVAAPRQHQLRSRQTRRFGAAPASATLLSLVGLAVLWTIAQPPLTDAVAGGTTSAGIMERLDGIAARSGLGLDQIEISGHRFTSDADISDAIDLPNVHSFLRLDDASVRARIERLAWVDTATIERRFPHRLDIRITERQPIAAWDRGPRDILVDATGRHLATVARGSVADLPRIAGELAPQDAPRLLRLIAEFPDIAERFERAERISGRRWRLFLRNTAQIELPADADAAALAMLVENHATGRLLDINAGIIDLTVLRRVTIRKSMPAPRT